LTSEGDILIKSDKIVIEGGKDIKIKAPTVNIEAGTLKCSGSTSAEIKGAKVDVKADGVLTLKGSVVNIN
jgi:phage baseplate assembly protein gpV